MTTTEQNGPGLFQHVNGNGDTITGGWISRRKAPAPPAWFRLGRMEHERERLKPGEGVIRIAAALLALLAAGLLYVSFSAQYTYVLSERHQASASLIEALSMDAAMIVLSLLAFGLALNGQKARTARVLVMVFAVLSGVMNYAAANDSSPRSVLAYALPPVALAIIADQTVTTVRRHILHVRGEDEVSSWVESGRIATTLLLRLLRFAFDPWGTAKDVRHRVLALAPLLDAEKLQVVATSEVPALPVGTKKAQLEAAYRAHPDAWNRDKAAKVATELARTIDMSEGTARGYVNELLKRREVA